MIGALAAATAPSIIWHLRDRRVTDAGSQIANLYRFARARSMGRGSAVNVRFENGPAALSGLDPLDPNARIAVREAIAAGLAAGTRTGFVAAGVAAGNQDQGQLGIPNCRTTNWAPLQAGTHYLGSFDERRSRYYPAVATFRDFADNPLSTGPIDICYTPRGRTFWSVNNGGFVDMAGVPYVRLENALEAAAERNSMIRKVIIPPTGAARLVTEI